MYTSKGARDHAESLRDSIVPASLSPASSTTRFRFSATIHQLIH